MIRNQSFSSILTLLFTGVMSSYLARWYWIFRSKSVNGLNLYAYCGNDSVNKYDPSGHIAITVAVGLPTAAYYAIIGILALCVVATVGYVESETHVISNTLESITNSIDEALDDIKDKIIEFTTALVVKNDYNSFEKHHIVAKRDPRAWFSRIILCKSGIDINDPRNLVYVKKRVP